MKTTIHIPDSLLREAQAMARREGTTLKALVQEGLRRVVDEHKRGSPFRLRRASFRGQGLNPEFDGLSWQHIRDMSYEGRGG